MMIVTLVSGCGIDELDAAAQRLGNELVGAAPGQWEADNGPYGNERHRPPGRLLRAEVGCGPEPRT